MNDKPLSLYTIGPTPSGPGHAHSSLGHNTQIVLVTIATAYNINTPKSNGLLLYFYCTQYTYAQIICFFVLFLHTKHTYSQIIQFVIVCLLHITTYMYSQIIQFVIVCLLHITYILLNHMVCYCMAIAHIIHTPTSYGLLLSRSCTPHTYS